MTRLWKPTKQQLADAYGGGVGDVVAPDLRVLFCGINPGLYSAAVGHHFARPGNRFWPALHLSGFTARRLSPFEEGELLVDALGITNIVDRATASAAELNASELRTGATALRAKVHRFRPDVVAVLGVGAYRIAFERPKAVVGPQPDPIASSEVWVLPNPSGLNAHYQLDDLAVAFARLRSALER